MKQITILSDNKTQVLADICSILGNSGVNIESISAQGEKGRGVIRIVTTDPTTAERELAKKGFNVLIGDVLVLKLNDKPGEMAKVARNLSREGIDLESLYLLSKDKGITYLAVKPAGDLEEVKRAVKSSLYFE